MARRFPPTRESGQALPESALTLPMVVFMVLCTLQLFMMLQGRLMAQYAAYKAVRAGSVNYGDCTPMMHAAIAALLPTVTNTENETRFLQAWDKFSNNDYQVGGPQHPIVEIVREHPLLAELPNGIPQDMDFDVPSYGANAQPRTLELRMLFWYHLRVPFANWVLTSIFLARTGLKAGPAANPYMLTDDTKKWKGNDSMFDDSTFPGGNVGTRVRKWFGAKQYFFPIKVNAVMRMMTPPTRRHFNQAACPVNLP